MNVSEEWSSLSADIQGLAYKEVISLPPSEAYITQRQGGGRQKKKTTHATRRVDMNVSVSILAVICVLPASYHYLTPDPHRCYNVCVCVCVRACVRACVPA